MNFETETLNRGKLADLPALLDYHVDIQQDNLRMETWVFVNRGGRLITKFRTACDVDDSEVLRHVKKRLMGEDEVAVGFIRKPNREEEGWTYHYGRRYVIYTQPR